VDLTGTKRTHRQAPGALNAKGQTVTIGVVSDTHGLLRPEAVERLHDVDQIIHAGDIGSAEIMAHLSALAPLTAVRGNNDRGDWARDIPETAVLHVGDVALYVLHDIQALDLDPWAAQIAVVISGHSHKPMIERRKRVLFMNPGSIGPRRFKLPVAMGRITVSGSRVSGRIMHLSV
jgi:uncharacterized protein